MINIDPKIFFNSGLESVAVLATQSGSNSVKVHFYEKPPAEILGEYEISGSQPIIYILKTDAINIKLNNSTSQITIDGVQYLFTNREPVNKFIDIYELAQ